MNASKNQISRMSVTLASAALKAHLTPATLAAIRLWLVEQLVAHEYAKLGQGGHTQNQVPLRRVFVDLPVANSPNAEGHDAGRTLFLDKLLASAPLKLNHACNLQGPRGSENDAGGEEIDLGEIDARAREFEFGGTLLIGGPGQGKSTLGQLACQLHRAALLKPYEAELTATQRDLVQSFDPNSSSSKKRKRHPLGLPRTPLIPFQIGLPELAAWLAKDVPEIQSGQVPSILRFIADLPSAKKHNVSPASLLALAVSMPSLIVLDGFDEVGAVEDRYRLVSAARELLTYLGERNAVAQVIATTRPQGYAGELAQIGVPLMERFLAPLSRAEALEYAQKLVEAKIPGADQRTKTLARLHEAAAESATSRLLTTPLQVTILTALVQQLGRAPRERWNLFSRYFSYTYDREIERDTYASRLLADHRSHIEQIHARVALLLQVEAERDGGASARMSRTRLESVIDAVLAEDEVSDIDRKHLVHEIAIAAEQRLVFLVEPEPGSFGFEIRSLQEFMAAWALTSGRDAEIESRLQQVARAPMFRNVALFAASRLFSEGSPLRDVLAERVCGELDADAADEADRLTRAGGLLALETLEEGAVLSQPKRARALMERAVSLLALPANYEHVRLARVANGDTCQILSDALEERLGAHATAGGASQSAWICLVECINRGDAWAAKVGDIWWNQLNNPTQLLHKCEVLGLPLGQWLREKITQHSARIDPSSLLNHRVLPDVDTLEHNWIAWLIDVYDSEYRWKQRRQGNMLFNFVAPRQLIRDEPDLAPPAEWMPWIQAARFELDPTAARLALALDEIAELLPTERWSSLHWRSAWPLALCLRSVESPNQLRQYAEELRAGKLGDIQEWERAQEQWIAPLDFSKVVDGAQNSLPWEASKLAIAPPLLALPYWAFAQNFRRRRESPTAVSLIKKASQAFLSVESPTLKNAIAQLSLFLGQRLPAKAPKSHLHPAEWLAVAPDDVGFLVPRPKWMPKSLWLELLNSVDLPVQPIGFSSADGLVDALLESDAHPVVIRLLVLTLEMDSRYATPSPTQWKHVAEILKLNTAPSLLTRIDKSLLEICIGNLPPERDVELIREISAAGEESSSSWERFLFTLRASRLSSKRTGGLLCLALTDLGMEHPLSGQVVNHLRGTQQGRKSGLENHVVWDRLALPLPYAEPPLHGRLDGNIPVRPVWLKSVQLRDVRGLRGLTLNLRAPSDDHGQWTVILGPNGIGKTTILGALALSLRNVKDPTIWPRGAFSSAWPHKPIKESSSRPEAEISVVLSDGIEHKTIFKPGATVNIVQYPEQDRPRLFPLFAYGCRRGSALGGAARQVMLNDDDGPEIATLFDEGAVLIHAETWLLQLDGDAPKNERSATILSAVKSAIMSLLDLEALEIVDQGVWVTEKGRPRLPLSALSDGYLTSAGWLIDLIARWLKLAERSDDLIDSDFLATMKGLVLIDEIDLHLHPRWQREIISRTRKLMPKMSFIVTTHNPLTLVGARAEEIWILSEHDSSITATSGIESPMLLTGGQIYRSYFEIDDIYPDGLGRALQRYGFLCGYTSRNDAEQTELEALGIRLNDAGLRPTWEIVPRDTGSHIELV